MEANKIFVVPFLYSATEKYFAAPSTALESPKHDKENVPARRVFISPFDVEVIEALFVAAVHAPVKSVGRTNVLAGSAEAAVVK